jgi:chemotaxis protein histidine kinase CheA
MTADPFAERLARVRQRFVSTLDGKIDGAFTALPKLSGEGSDAVATIGEVYREMHGIAGVGPTVGFPLAGQAARAVENVLRDARLESRTLAADEIKLLKNRLDELRGAAARELQFFHAL